MPKSKESVKESVIENIPSTEHLVENETENKDEENSDEEDGVFKFEDKKLEKPPSLVKKASTIL